MRIVATRLHTTNENTPINIDKIAEWCEHVLNYCDILIVVVDKRYYEATHDILESYGERIQRFSIHPWISFTQPLNLLVEKALSMGAKELLFQSIEVSISLKDMILLEEQLQKDTLVVGAKLCERHGHDKKISTINGWTTPWNTLALWNLEKLALTGFLTISSGNLNNIKGGIEEVVTISLLQKLHPSSMNAKVIQLSSVVWNTNWSTEERSAYHQKKMMSKDERSQIQLKKLAVDAGSVIMVK
jgi:hypothetical protein